MAPTHPQARLLCSLSLDPSSNTCLSSATYCIKCRVTVTQDKVTLKWVLWPTQHIVRRPIRIESIEKIVSSGCFEALGRVPQVKMGGEY